MKRYQITIDFHNPTNEKAFFEALNLLGENKQVFNNTWLVKSTLSVTEVSDKLDAILDKKDYTSVLPLDSMSGSALKVHPEVVEWLKN